MIIILSPDELEEEFRQPWKLGLISQVSLDYADNALYANFEGRQVIILRFKNYGFLHDNRYNTYCVSSGQAGIMINITAKK